MDKQELQIIQELMEVLQDKMQYGEDDLSERLGRKKPGIEVVKVEGKMPMDGDPSMPKDEEPMGMDMGGDEDMGPEMAMDDSPDDQLKRRLMKMRA